MRALLSRALFVLALASPPAAALAADDIASLPLGDPARAFQLVSGEAGQWLDLAGPAHEGSRVAALEAVAKDLARADVVLIGEHHTHQAGHEAQARLLSALVATGRPMALGMEFFESEDDAALARFVAGDTDVEAMLLETGWYEGGGFNFEYYRPLVEIARAAKAPILGLNVPRSLVRTISREGFEKLSEADRARVGELGEVNPRHRFVVDAMMGGFSATMPSMFDGMYRGQCSWDAAMARSVLRAREGVAKGRLIVVIVGIGHVGHGLGIPERLRALQGQLDVRVVAPVIAPRPAPEAVTHPGFEPTASATFSRGFGEVACILPDEQGAEAHPTYGITLEEKEGALRIASVEAGGVASRAGLAKDDVLESVNGQDVTSLPRARLALAATRWMDRVVLGVRRDGQAMSVPILVVPATDGPGRWMKSEPLSAALDSFDPAATQAFGQTPKPASGLPRARLVRFGDDAARLDIFDGQALAQAWQLDASGRPVLGLLARPAADGAVRVELTRDGSGVVTSQRRLDASGAVIAPAEAKAGSGD